MVFDFLLLLPRMCAQFIGDCIKMKEKLYGLELNEMEFAALAGLWMFATCKLLAL